MHQTRVSFLRYWWSSPRGEIQHRACRYLQQVSQSHPKAESCSRLDSSMQDRHSSMQLCLSQHQNSYSWTDDFKATMLGAVSDCSFTSHLDLDESTFGLYECRCKLFSFLFGVLQYWSRLFYLVWSKHLTYSGGCWILGCEWKSSCLLLALSPRLLTALRGKHDG